MSRVAYCNGAYVRQDRASISIMDRSVLFADAVYEVFAVRSRRLVDESRHFTRLLRSLDELAIELPMSLASLRAIAMEIVRRNRVTDGLVYLQVTRGAPRVRDHAFPDSATTPAGVILFARAMNFKALQARAERGIAVTCVPETRWDRCDIKSTALLANVLARQTAKDDGAEEAWFVDEAGEVVEGASSNAWIVDAAGVLRTRDLGANLLPGVTRATIQDIAREQGLDVVEEAFSRAEALAAREAFVTSAMSLVTPVVRLDGQPIGAGRPGPIALALRRLYLEAHDLQAPPGARP